MRYVLRYYKPYAAYVILILLMLFGQAMCELALPGYMSDIINNGIVAGDMGYIKSTGLIMTGVSAAAVVCSVGGSFLAARVSAGSSRDIRKALFERVTSFSAAELEEFSTASLITRSTNDIQMVQQANGHDTEAGVLCSHNGHRSSHKSAWHQRVPFMDNRAGSCGHTLHNGSFVFPCAAEISGAAEKAGQAKSDNEGKAHGTAGHKSLHHEKDEERNFDNANRELTKINLFVNKAMSFMMPALMFVMNAVSVLIIWAGAHLIDRQELMIGDMLAYLQYAMHVIMSFLFITMMFIMIPRAAVSAQRIGGVLKVESSVRDTDDPKTPALRRGIVEFRNVSFAYPDAEEKTIDSVSFTAEPGKTTAIIGGTGSGKSTLISLIPRFYDATEGAVLVDGVDVRDMSQHDLRDMIGYVPQKGVLFSGTIASNLRYGREEATDEDLAEAAEIAQALDFIKEKERGLRRRCLRAAPMSREDRSRDFP